MAKNILALLFLLCGFNLEAQMDWKNDAILRTWPLMLSPPWTMRQEGDTLIVQKDEAVFILWENKINAPLDLETAEKRSARIREFGVLEKPKIVFTMRPRTKASEGTLSSIHEITLKETMGIEDEFHSVEKLAVSAEVWALREKLLESLSQTIPADSDLAEWVNRLITVRARKAKTISQHRISPPVGYPYSEYIDIGNTETVVYSRIPLHGSGPWIITGWVCVLEPPLPDPRRKESVQEMQLIAEEVVLFQGE